MPEQSSKRGNQVTSAGIDSPFETLLLRFGVEGWNLRDELDQMKPGALPRMTNVDHDSNGAITSRPGQTSLATGGTKHHSVRKLRDPQNSTFTRVWGIDTSLYIGASGGLANIDAAGYSGDPITLVPHRPPLSGDPWMFVADRSRMRKVRADGLDLPIGLPAPSAAPTTVLGPFLQTKIAAFDPAVNAGIQDGTSGQFWTPNSGFDFSDPPNPTNVPNTIVDSGTFYTSPGSAVAEARKGYYSYWNLARVLNLSLVGGQAASDDDLLHFIMKFEAPQRIAEIRFYFVVSNDFDATILPGTDAGLNTNFYVKSFRPDDFIQFVQGLQSQVDAAAVAQIHAQSAADLEARRLNDLRTSWLPAALDPARKSSFAAGSGVSEFLELSSVGLPVRRGDFQRVGGDQTATWGTVTGLVIYIQTLPGVPAPLGLALDVGITFIDMYLMGGAGPDTSAPGLQQYDYRAAHYDPRTGAEGNGSPEQATTLYLDSLRREIDITPQAHSDSAMRQRIYRRGGTLFDDWYFVGVNTSNGGLFADTLTDDAIAAVGTLALDHYEAVPTVDDNGDTVLAQPLPALWGPIEGMLFGCGDRYRPGHLYFSNPDAPDHWSANGNTEVCPPSEELMHGGLLGSQGFVFSRTRLYFIYPSLTSAGSVTTTATLCKRGLTVSKWAFCVGPGGIYFLAEDGIFLTSGGIEEWVSKEIDPLFHGQTRYGYAPIDFAAVQALRMTVWESKLYFSYQDTNGALQTLVYSILNQFWRHYTFGRAPTMLQGEDEDLLLIGALNLGATYTFEGVSDAGLAISCTVRTGSPQLDKREEKLLGDQILDADRQGVELTLQNFLNEEATTNLPQLIAEGSGRQRYVLDGFGESPQKAHSLSTEIRWASALAAPILYQLGYAITLQPDITNRRVTNWDDLGSTDENWVSGITLDVDTAGVDRHIHFERDFGGTKSSIAQADGTDIAVVNTDGRHKVKISWPAVPAHMVRIRPDDDCKFWLLYRADWLSLPEPPRVSRWDIHFENAWDQYYTGLDLYCDTSGAEKRVEVYVDEVRLNNPATGLSYFSVTANGRRVVHLTLPWGRGHVFRFKAIDDNPGLLYQHRWHLDPEPTEQANFLANFTPYGSLADKYLKAILMEVDTYGQNKTINVEADGVVVDTLTINTNGRQVVQPTLSVQKLGRVWRMFPVDSNPGRLYSSQPVFDEEPLQLARWETQESNHGLPGWFYLTHGHITLKSTQDVVLTVVMHHNQTGGRTTKLYTIPATGGLKQRCHLPFEAGKGVLVKYLLTSTVPFFLYQEETNLWVHPWGAADPILVRPFGNADITVPTRSMIHAEVAASRSGGGSE